MKPIFSLPLTVQREHIDSLEHVNNEVYLRWILMAAGAHSESLGYTMSFFLNSGGCFVVRKHELNYLLPTHLGEHLVIETWITSLKAAQSTRAYRIKRVKDDRVIFTAETLWVYIDLNTGRPIEIPIDMRENYGRFLHE
jgi:acyl-CoA thioester hydrolase